ncbi:MAG: sigma 54-interacting transcriptional regulator [Planctomycetes bacterium]|nr:sigma 54-interacting transcriptional regulator [Planctomycetota bacterium]
MLTDPDAFTELARSLVAAADGAGPALETLLAEPAAGVVGGTLAPELFACRLLAFLGDHAAAAVRAERLLAAIQTAPSGGGRPSGDAGAAGVAGGEIAVDALLVAATAAEGLDNPTAAAEFLARAARAARAAGLRVAEERARLALAEFLIARDDAAQASVILAGVAAAARPIGSPASEGRRPWAPDAPAAGQSVSRRDTPRDAHLAWLEGLVFAADGGGYSTLAALERFTCALEALGDADRQELEWEIRFALAGCLARDGQESEAARQLVNAQAICRDLAGWLPAARRSAFLADPRRARLFAEAAPVAAGSGAPVGGQTPAPGPLAAGEGERRSAPGQPLSGEEATGPPAKDRTDRFARRSLPLGFHLSGTELLALERERNMLLRLAAINRRLAGEFELSRVLETIIDGAMEMTGATRGFLILLEEGRLRLAAARGPDGTVGAPDGEALEFSRHVAARVIESGEPLFTVDAQADQRFSAVGSEAGLRLTSILCVPLRPEAAGRREGGAEVLGALALDNRMRKGAFAPGDTRFIQAFAVQAALAIRGARLLEENVRAREELTRRNRDLAEAEAALRRDLAARQTELAQTQRQLRLRERELSRLSDAGGIVGVSEAIRQVIEVVHRVAESGAPVLLHGESGTGKALVARCIHQAGPTREREFVAVNCSALPEALLESELFGHVRGAFTGAHRDRKGLFELAAGGTLFLDEVGDMPPGMQAKLLTAIEEGVVRPVGAEKTVKVDARVITATNKDLEALVRAGAFREDLYFRVNVVKILLPPLRERREDIPLLLDHALREAAAAAEARGAKVKTRRVSADALEIVTRYDWPGNVRELRNFAERATLFAEGDAITAHDVLAHLPGAAAPATPPATVSAPTATSGSPPAAGEPPKAGEGAGAGESAPATEGSDAARSYRGARASFDRDIITAALRRSGGNVSAAARELGIQRRQLYRLMARLEIGAGAAGKLVE